MPAFGGGHALINGVTLTDLALYPSEAIETPQHADEIILLCSIIHGSDILRYGSFGCGCAVPRVAPPTLSYLPSRAPSKSAPCHAQSCSQRAHNPTQRWSAALSALLFRVRHPVPRCACAYKSDCGSSFPVTNKLAAQARGDARQ